MFTLSIATPESVCDFNNVHVCPLFNVSILAVISAWFFHLGFNLCV